MDLNDDQSSTNFCNILHFFLQSIPLLILGLFKAAIIGPVATIIILVGNSGVAAALWPVHVVWTYYSFIRAKYLGVVLKIIVLIGLVVPLVVFPVLVVVGSTLAGMAYGVFVPVVATFEAMGEQWRNKYISCIVDGTGSTLKGSCIVVQDFADVCYFSYFSFMEELCEQCTEEQPLDIKLLQLPASLFVALLGVLIDVPIITLLAIWKSPYMLLKGWNQLIRDLIGREGLFADAICFPFASLVLLVWPVVVILACIAAFLSSFLLGIYGAAVVYQESSVRLGLSYIISAISLFDEYTNDLIYLREGSCFPRPNYRRENKFSRSQSKDSDKLTNTRDKKKNSLAHQRCKNEQGAYKQRTPLQVWDQFFQSFECHGLSLIQDGVIKVIDLTNWLQSGKEKVIGIGFPAYCILQDLLSSANSDSTASYLFEGLEVTKFDRPEDRIFGWFIEPLKILRDEIKAYKLQESEALYLSKLVLFCQPPERKEAYENGGTAPEDLVKRARLEALSRRLHGITTSISRMPTFRRRYRKGIKILLQLALSTGEGNLSEILEKDHNSRNPECSRKPNNEINKMIQKEKSMSEENYERNTP